MLWFKFFFGLKIFKPVWFLFSFVSDYALMSRNAGKYENGNFGKISSSLSNCKISQNYANELIDFILLQYMLVDLVIWRSRKNFVKFIESAKIMQIILMNITLLWWWIWQFLWAPFFSCLELCMKSARQCHSLTHPLYAKVACRASTCFFHICWSLAINLMPSQVFPISLISFSTVRLHMILGRPLFHFP